MRWNDTNGILGISELRWKGIEYWWNNHWQRQQTLLQQERRQAWAWRWIPGQQRHYRHCHGLLSSRLITIRMRAAPFNITIIQTYAPTTDYDDSEVEDFYEQLQAILDQVPKKDIIIVQGKWNAKVGQDTYHNWRDTQGPHCHNMTNDRGLRLLEFARYNNLILANTLGQHKKSRRWTWHSPNGEHHNQTTSWSRTASDRVSTLVRHARTQERILVATMIWLWCPFGST